MTPQLLTWLSELPPFHGSVVEIGAYNVNGSARDHLGHSHWLGTDMRPGPYVDWVIPGERLGRLLGPVFQGVVCMETLEHCEDWAGVLQSAWECLSYTGVLVLSTPGHDFPKHDYPHDYWRFSLEFWRKVFAGNIIQNEADFYYPHNGHALTVTKIKPFLHLNHEPMKVK